ncbi:hypothetical protein [Lentilactobacillus parafarraginis]|uniref:hypothetical protein n=1 Tax=Lentilactobacillus parafarraginis TaxID=390842 RepID=UPI00148734B0|nr:hypothetical protein [Lentilactobacillus parafarraginis]
MLEISLPISLLSLVIMIVTKVRGDRISWFILIIFIISLAFVAPSLITFANMPD